LIQNKKSGEPELLSVLFFLLGLFSALAASLGNASPDSGPHWAETAASAFKNFIETRPWKGEETAALLKAFLAGDKSSLSKDTVSLFRKAGGSHLLALSGLHLGIIYMIVQKVFSLAGASPSVKKIRYVLLLSAAGFFTIMTGASPSIVRAFLFIAVRETAAVLGRRATLARTLCLALLFQLLILGDERFYYMVYDKTLKTSSKMFTGELRFFFNDYKNYYYLPAEDRAVHKSVASFVDKGHRFRAKPSNCYMRKEGTYIPQYDKLCAPFFSFNYNDTVTYFEISDAFTGNTELITKYAENIIRHQNA